jgi:UDP-MurNAc hydroxylase
LYEQLPSIVEEDGPISVFTCQFSGATWHPTCYDYTPQEYERIAEQKSQSKFEMIARAIESAGADVYLPSAGPACFLDPALMHLNFERVNIFPRASKFLDFLDTRLSDSRTKPLDIAPGDVLEMPSHQLVAGGSERVDDNNLKQYLDSYAGEYRRYFEELRGHRTGAELDSILERLRVEIDRKLSHFTLHHRVQVPLYFGLSDAPARKLRIDFQSKTTQCVEKMSDSDFCSISAPSWQLARILDGEITWEEFALTFRMRLNRRPDVYQTLIQGFLLMEPEDMNWFCAQLLEIEDRQKRIVVEAAGTHYSIDRFCPHQGADLSQGWLSEGNLWTCPRHRWQFALDHGGRCLTSDAGIHAVCLEND